MAKGGFDYSEFEKLAEDIKSLEKESKKFIENFLYRMALRTLAKTKERTPVDTGDLRNAWYLSGIAWRGDTVMIKLNNPKLYASFVELGHWQEVGRYVPAIERRLVNPWVEGRYMLSLSIQEIEREMPRRLEAAWKKFAAGRLK